MADDGRTRLSSVVIQKPELCSTIAHGRLPLVTLSVGFLNLCQVRIQPARIATTSADVLRLCKRSGKRTHHHVALLVVTQ